MRIVHVVVSMDPAQGGPPAVVSRLAAGQAAMNADRGRDGTAPGETAPRHHVMVISHGSPGREAQISASLKGIPHFAAVNFIALPPQLRFGMIVPKSTRHLLRQQIAPADVVHLHGVWDPLVRAASVEARRLGVPYVLTTHGMLDPWCLQQRWLKKKLALALMYRRMLVGARCLHLLNEDESDLIKPLKLPTPQRVIPNGVFMEEFEPLPPPGSFHASHPELKGQPFILFLSRLHHKKGLDYLAEAFAILATGQPAVHLVVAGPDDGAKSAFEQRVVQAGMSERVHLVGPLYSREKFAAMVDSVCFCLPSRQEGFSMAITESLACATPVVISRNCHFPDVATAGAGEVVELEAGAVAAALERMLVDPVRRDRMGRAGRELVLSRYTWPTIAAQVIAMYEAALGRSDAVPN